MNKSVHLSGFIVTNRVLLISGVKRRICFADAHTVPGSQTGIDSLLYILVRWTQSFNLGFRLIAVYFSDKYFVLPII